MPRGSWIPQGLLWKCTDVSNICSYKVCNGCNLSESCKRACHSGSDGSKNDPVTPLIFCGPSGEVDRCELQELENREHYTPRGADDGQASSKVVPPPPVVEKRYRSKTSSDSGSINYLTGEDILDTSDSNNFPGLLCCTTAPAITKSGDLPVLRGANLETQQGYDYPTTSVSHPDARIVTDQDHRTESQRPYIHHRGGSRHSDSSVHSLQTIREEPSGLGSIYEEGSSNSETPSPFPPQRSTTHDNDTVRSSPFAPSHIPKDNDTFYSSSVGTRVPDSNYDDLSSYSNRMSSIIGQEEVTIASINRIASPPVHQHTILLAQCADPQYGCYQINHCVNKNQQFFNGCQDQIITGDGTSSHPIIYPYPHAEHSFEQRSSSLYGPHSPFTAINASPPPGLRLINESTQSYVSAHHSSPGLRNRIMPPDTAFSLSDLLSSNSSVGTPVQDYRPIGGEQLSYSTRSVPSPVDKVVLDPSFTFGWGKRFRSA